MVRRNEASHAVGANSCSMRCTIVSLLELKTKEDPGVRNEQLLSLPRSPSLVNRSVCPGCSSLCLPETYAPPFLLFPTLGWHRGPYRDENAGNRSFEIIIQYCCSSSHAQSNISSCTIPQQFGECFTKPTIEHHRADPPLRVTPTCRAAMFDLLKLLLKL